MRFFLSLSRLRFRVNDDDEQKPSKSCRLWYVDAIKREINDIDKSLSKYFNLETMGNRQGSVIV